MRFTGSVQRYVLKVLLCLTTGIAACGGGSEGNGDTDSSLKIDFSTSSLDMVVLEGDAAGADSRIIVARGTGGTANDSIYVGAEIEGVGILTPVSVDIDTSSRIATILVRPDPMLAAGTYVGKLRLLACKDALCGSHFRGSPHTVDYSVVVQPRLKASVTSLSFAAPESASISTQRFDITLPHGVSQAAHSVSYSEGASNWLQVTHQGTTYVVQPSSLLPSGTYTANIDFDVGDVRQPLRVPVHLEISNGLVTVGTLDLAINSATPASQTSGSLSVDVAAGVNIVSWSARSTVPWLVIDNPTGTVSERLRWHLDATQFGELANSKVHAGLIHVEGGGAVTPRDVSVTLSKQIAEMNGIDHFAVLAGEPGEVMLYGEHFDQLPAPFQSVVVAGVAPISVNRMSDKLMSVRVPALSTGSYPITIASTSGLPSRSLLLQVIAPRDHGYQVIATAGVKGPIFWDAMNQSVYVLNATLSSVMKFELGGSVVSPTGTVSARSIPGLWNIGRTPDLHSVLALTAAGTLMHINPANLNILRSLDTGAQPSSLYLGRGQPLAVTGDSRLWYPTATPDTALVNFDLLHDQLEAAVAVSNPTEEQTVSPNGQRMLVGQSGLSSGAAALRRDIVDGAFTTYSADVATKVVDTAISDRGGRRWLINGSMVYDFNFAVEGEISLPAGWYGFGGPRAVSRDGTRAYILAFHESSIGRYSEPNPIVYKHRMYVFDIGTPLVTTTRFPGLGYIELNDSPSCRVDDGTCNAYTNQYLLTDDDRTLIAVGDRNLVVLPVPAYLRGGTPSVGTTGVVRRLPVASR